MALQSVDAAGLSVPEQVEFLLPRRADSELNRSSNSMGLKVMVSAVMLKVQAAGDGLTHADFRQTRAEVAR